MEWVKINAGHGVINYASGPYKLETAPMGTIGEGLPMWCATIMKDGHVGSVEVWGVGTEVEIIGLCEKAARVTGLLL